MLDAIELFLIGFGTLDGLDSLIFLSSVFNPLSVLLKYDAIKCDVSNSEFRSEKTLKQSIIFHLSHGH